MAKNGYFVKDPNVDAKKKKRPKRKKRKPYCLPDGTYISKGRSYPQVRAELRKILARDSGGSG